MYHYSYFAVLFMHIRDIVGVAPDEAQRLKILIPRAWGLRFSGAPMTVAKCILYLLVSIPNFQSFSTLEPSGTVGSDYFQSAPSLSCIIREISIFVIPVDLTSRSEVPFTQHTQPLTWIYYSLGFFPYPTP